MFFNGLPDKARKLPLSANRKTEINRFLTFLSFGRKMNPSNQVILAGGIAVSIIVFIITLLTVTLFVDQQIDKQAQQILSTLNSRLNHEHHLVGDLQNIIKSGSGTHSKIQSFMNANEHYLEVMWLSDKEQKWFYARKDDPAIYKLDLNSPLVPKIEALRNTLILKNDQTNTTFVDEIKEFRAKNNHDKVYSISSFENFTNVAHPIEDTYLVAVIKKSKLLPLSDYLHIDHLNQIDLSYNATAINLDFNRVQDIFSFLFDKKYTYVTEIDSQPWNVVFDVILQEQSRLLSLLPYFILFVMLTAVIFISYFANHKQKDLEEVGEITQALEGASQELKAKISEHDQLMIALRKSDREHRAVMNSVSDIIFETDEQGRILFLNDSWRRITGTEIDKSMYKVLFDFIDQREQIKQRDMFLEMIAGRRQAYRVETSMIFENGLIKPFEISFSMMRLAEDKTIRVVGTMTDIEQRRKSEIALREAEQKFRSIVENSISGIYQTTIDGQFISANPALAQILGYADTKELMASVQDMSSELYTDKEHRVKLLELLRTEGMVSGLESQMLRKDGSTVWIIENARAIKDAAGGILYYEGSITDITMRRRMEEDLREAKVMAELSSRSKMEFLANMSHELRTPLNAIIGFSEIIKDEIMGPLGEPSYKEYARDIFESGHSLLKIISEILELSRIETGNRILNQTNIKIAKVIKSCVAIVGTKIDDAGLKVNVNIPLDLPEVLAEELALKQIMLNVIGNAIKFTPRNGAITINAMLLETTSELAIEVIDTGHGMSAEQLERAMRPFGQVETAFDQQKNGVGLGLTIVNALSKLHEARFELYSEQNKGTRAVLIIPAHRILKPKMSKIS